MRFRGRSAVAALSVIALVLVACAGDNDPAQAPDDDAGDSGEVEDEADEPDDEAAEDEPAEASEAGDGDIELRWRTRPSNEEEIEVYAQVNEDIAPNLDNVRLRYEPGATSGSAYQDALRTELASGTAPDVFWIPGTDIADFALRGIILDVREFADQDDGYADDDYFSGPMEFLTYDPDTQEPGGPLWGLPRDISTFAYYLNLDLIAEAGADDPRELAEAGEWDWDAFLEVARAVNEIDGNVYGFGAGTWWAHWGRWVNSAGGGLFNADRTACALDEDASLAGLEFLRRVYVDEQVAMPFGEDVEPAFLGGSVGMYQNGRWGTPAARSAADFEWDVVAPPHGPEGAGNWQFWGAYVVNADTEHPEESWELLRQLTSPDTQLAVAELGTNIPSYQSDEALDQFLTFTPPENNQAFLDGLLEGAEAEGPLWEGDWPEYDATMQPLVTDLLTGGLSLDEFEDRICRELDQTFNG
jgi:multiple sugar transport system substrate-binding protein